MAKRADKGGIITCLRDTDMEDSNLFDFEAERRRARDVVNNMEKGGKIVRSAFCWLCGAMTDTAMHHPRYSKPRCVTHLCAACHTIADRLRQARESGKPLELKQFDWERQSLEGN